MELIPLSQQQIADQPEPTVDARELHAFLEVGRRFASWIQNRIEQYGFKENQDFVLVSQNGETKGSGGDRRSKDYFLSLDMAKELAMVERTEKGREARRYFIACERRLQDRGRARLGAAQRREALPVPAGPREPSPALRSAIDRKAHAVSLRAFQSAVGRMPARRSASCRQSMAEPPSGVPPYAGSHRLSYGLAPPSPCGNARPDPSHP